MAGTFKLDLVGEERGCLFGGEDGRYRYDLWRVWGSGERVAFIGLNPSIADGGIDDPTVRRCRNFARAWGFDGFHVGNLFAYRATDPGVLEERLRLDENMRGPDNEMHLRRLASTCAKVICCWGSGGVLDCAHQWGCEVLKDYDLYHMGLCQRSGQPRHPLYLRTGVTPALWRGKVK